MGSLLLFAPGLATAGAEIYHTSMEDQPPQGLHPRRNDRLSLPPLDQQRRASRTEQLVVAMRRAIVTLTLKPGVRLSEQEVADRFQVSRQPVREAFIRLTASGLVRVHPQRGTFVAKISAEAILDAHFVREAVETAIARRAARLACPADIAALERELKLQRRAGRSTDSVLFFDLDEQFHRLLAAIAQRPNAWRAIEEAKAQIDRVRYLTLLEEQRLKRRIEQHERIAAAIAAGRQSAAAAAMKEHLSGLSKSLPRLREQWSDLFDNTPSAEVALGSSGRALP